MPMRQDDPLSNRNFFPIIRPVATLGGGLLVLLGAVQDTKVSPLMAIAGAILAGLAMISDSLDRRAAPPT